MSALRNWVRCDALAAGVAGFTQLLGRYLFAPLSGLSAGTFAMLGFIGLGYSVYSGTLTVRRLYRPPFMRVLVFANLAYSAFLLVLLLLRMAVLTSLGIAHLLLESAFVAVLAILELRAARQAGSW